MERTRKIFHLVSYLQYPFVIAGSWFIISPLIFKTGDFWQGYNNALIFFGLGISLSTLQDTSKTQNSFSKKVWESPRKGKFFIGMFSVAILIFLGAGLYFYLKETESIMKEVSIGLIVLGIGSISMLKSMIEMREHHRKDKP